jgi:hypothetical protein
VRRERQAGQPLRALLFVNSILGRLNASPW